MSTEGQFQTPDVAQEQMVDVAYAWLEGDFVRRTYDRASRTTAWHRAKYVDEVPPTFLDGPAESHPPVSSWVPYPDPTAPQHARARYTRR